MYETDEIDITENQDNEKSDIEIIREKYEDKKIRKADEIIAVQAVICIFLIIGFFVANIFYPDVCNELYSILEKSVKSSENPVPFISDYI